MIAFFSRRRAAIEARYAELLRDYRAAHGHDPAPAPATPSPARPTSTPARARNRPAP